MLSAPFLMEIVVCGGFTSSVSLLLSFPVLQNVIRQQRATDYCHYSFSATVQNFCLPHKIEILSAFAETSLF